MGSRAGRSDDGGKTGMDWVEGDFAGIAMPTHPDALRAAGPHS